MSITWSKPDPTASSATASSRPPLIAAQGVAAHPEGLCLPQEEGQGLVRRSLGLAPERVVAGYNRDLAAHRVAA